MTVANLSHIQAPSVIYHGLHNTLIDPAEPNVLQDLTDKDLWVLHSLLNQAQGTVQREMSRRLPHGGMTPAW